jgi:superfamily II DNA or RNA helicase
LLPVQLDLLDRGRSAYDPKRGIFRVVWQAPCGFGKTWVAAMQTKLALALGKRVLHIVHRRRLVDQMIRTLAEFGIHATAIMQGRLRWDSPVMCASRDTLLAMLKDGVDLPAADLIIVDECHVAAEAIHAYYLRRHPGAFWTGNTATPVRSDGRSLAPPYQVLVCAAPAAELIRLGRLCPVRVYNPDGVGRRRLKGDKVKPVGDPVAHWKRYGEDSATIAFAGTVRQSVELAERYRAEGIIAEHLDASTPDEEREAIFERSRTGQTKVICNCGVLIEGVDLPWVRCCQILRGCNSIVLWFQAIGRVMRAFAGKEYAIVLDHAGAAHEFGLPDAPVGWFLGDEKTVARVNKPPKERRPVTCPHCGLIFSPRPACPECGKVLPKKRRYSLVGHDGEDGLLTRFTGQAGAVNQDRIDRAFRKAYFIVRNKGGTMAQVNAIFARESGMPAWQAGLSVKLPFGRAEWQSPAKDWVL